MINRDVFCANYEFKIKKTRALIYVDNALTQSEIKNLIFVQILWILYAALGF